MNHIQWQYRLLLSLLLPLVLAVSACQETAKEPERPDSIPKEAFWVGGPDGGVFLQIWQNPKDSSHLYQAKIYYAHGEIWYAGPLMAEHREQPPIDIDKREDFEGWDGEKLILSGGRTLRPPRHRNEQ